jgi:hypothetical protein
LFEEKSNFHTEELLTVYHCKWLVQDFTVPEVHVFGTGSILVLICRGPGGRYSPRPLRMTQVTQLLKFHQVLKENPKQNLYPANKTSIFHPCEC